MQDGVGWRSIVSAPLRAPFRTSTAPEGAPERPSCRREGDQLVALLGEQVVGACELDSLPASVVAMTFQLSVRIRFDLLTAYVVDVRCDSGVAHPHAADRV
jgi:hypothetical protein